MKLNKEQEVMEGVIDLLWDIAAGNISAPCGICSAVSEYLEANVCGGFPHAIPYRFISELKVYGKMWPKYSGNPALPIPRQSYRPGESFNEVNKKHAQYGSDRRELAAFWAVNLEEDYL